MAFRKFAADYLFTGHEMLGNDVVLITDTNGKVHDIVSASEASEGVERYNGIITPGFINCHCHLELSHLKGKVPLHTGMVRFLLTVMNDRNIAEAEIEEAILYEEAYMREKGIVAAGDICNTTHTINAKKTSSLYFHNFVEATGFAESSADLRFRQAKDVYTEFTKYFTATSIVPHAPYSVSDKLLKTIDEFDRFALLSIHNQESEAEAEFFAYATGGFLELYRQLNIDVRHLQPYGKTSFRHCVENIGSDHTLILVHNVHTSSEDLHWASTLRTTLPQLWWCLCPNANLFISNQLPDVTRLNNATKNIVIGTDSVASNTQLNILEELKTLQNNFPALSTELLLSWATINGAEALGIGSRYGSFEKGKKPGVVVIHGGTNKSLQGTVSRRVL